MLYTIGKCTCPLSDEEFLQLCADNNFHCERCEWYEEEED